MEKSTLTKYSYGISIKIHLLGLENVLETGIFHLINE